MEPVRFEPFGERLVQEESLGRPGRASKWLLWTGSAVFWSLVVVIVAARAAYFEPGIFAGFDRLASLARAIF